MFLFINFSNNISCITFQLSEIDEQISIYNLQVYSMNFQYLVFLKTKLPREKFWKAIVSFTAMVQRIAHYFSSALTLALNDFARLEPPSLLTLSRDILFLFTPSLYFIFPLWSISAYELSHPAVDHAVCILRIASLLSACLTISLSHFLPSFPPAQPFSRSFSVALSFVLALRFSVSLVSARRGSREAEICWLLQATEGRQRENGRTGNEEREGTRPQRLRSARFYRADVSSAIIELLKSERAPLPIT